MPDETAVERIRTRVTYNGRVQGVGFRYTALHVSRSYRIAGYVRNMPNGTVELEAEGDAGQVQAFLAALAEQMGGNIRDESRSPAKPTHREETFEITF